MGHDQILFGDLRRFGMCRASVLALGIAGGKSCKASVVVAHLKVEHLRLSCACRINEVLVHQHEDAVARAAISFCACTNQLPEAVLYFFQCEAQRLNSSTSSLTAKKLGAMLCWSPTSVFKCECRANGSRTLSGVAARVVGTRSARCQSAAQTAAARDGVVVSLTLPLRLFGAAVACPAAAAHTHHCAYSNSMFL